MHALNVALGLGASLSLCLASLHNREINDPVGIYLDSMCYPLYTNQSRTIALKLSINEMIPSLAFSPFPCEQALYLRAICIANGTTVDDFLAEQECLCHGSFFEVTAGCDDCLFAHGYQLITPQEAAGNLSSRSVAECAPTPPFQPYTNLIGVANITSASLSPPLTPGHDKFPNMTAVSNYFTETASATPGSITGSATARLTSWTNTEGNIYTPTSIPPDSGTGSASAVSTTSSGSTSQSTNVAATRGVGVVGGLLAAGVGVMAIL
ncbi:uncharacterized protein LY89DRAFT_687534 [Mollisia scopiformis]|uniref:Uncharacterized protein n=1 Tax=Mollisia scopiformis TaxID=149040 RepID=A0A194WZP3_MOLSC|nr:uncharacterized protein LY89DRAFT_687534 [Mollisia scopiformis]KUJ13416.1 hypothetical protein LY89DRAFT_687534 [Mollisia scopiformis]